MVMCFGNEGSHHHARPFLASRYHSPSGPDKRHKHRNRQLSRFRISPPHSSLSESTATYCRYRKQSGTASAQGGTTEDKSRMLGCRREREKGRKDDAGTDRIDKPKETAARSARELRFLTWSQRPVGTFLYAQYPSSKTTKYESQSSPKATVRTARVLSCKVLLMSSHPTHSDLPLANLI